MIPGLRLWEFYIVDVGYADRLFREAWNNRAAAKASTVSKSTVETMLVRQLVEMGLHERSLLIRDTGICTPVVGIRFEKMLANEMIDVFVDMLYCNNANQTVDAAAAAFAEIIDNVNLDGYREYDEDVRVILENVRSRAKYLRVDLHGPRLGPVSKR